MNERAGSLMIDKIVLTDFHAFQGKNKFLLGTTPDKFVNIITGPNGSGKSTIVYALQWAFNRCDPECFGLGGHTLNTRVMKSLKNHHAAESSVQVYLTGKHPNQRFKIVRTCVYRLNDDVLSRVSDVQTIQEWKGSHWADIKGIDSWGSLPLLLLNGEQNPEILIRNILPCISDLTHQPHESIKEILSSVIHEKFRNRYPESGVIVEFDENGMLYVKCNDTDLLPTLSSGDAIALWISLVISINERIHPDLPLLMHCPVSRLDTIKRVQIAESLKSKSGDRQLILIGSDLELEPMINILKPVTNSQYHLGIAVENRSSEAVFG